MVAAVISEFNEFPTFDAEARNLLFVGLFYSFLLIIAAGFMVYKYTFLNAKKYQAKHPE